MAKNFVIKLGLYPYDVMVSIAQSERQLLKDITSKYTDVKPDDIEAIKADTKVDWDGCVQTLENNLVVLRLTTRPKDAYSYGVLAHEICHVVYDIMDGIGSKLTLGSSDEPYAYLTGYLTQEILKQL